MGGGGRGGRGEKREVGGVEKREVGGKDTGGNIQKVVQ